MDEDQSESDNGVFSPSDGSPVRRKRRRKMAGVVVNESGYSTLMGSTSFRQTVEKGVHVNCSKTSIKSSPGKGYHKQTTHSSKRSKLGSNHRSAKRYPSDDPNDDRQKSRQIHKIKRKSNGNY